MAALFALVGVIGVLCIIRLVPGAIQSLREVRDGFLSLFRRKPPVTERSDRA